MANLEGLLHHCEFMYDVWVQCGHNSEQFARVVNGLWEILGELSEDDMPEEEE
jgi:hypothetical protein